MRTSQCIFGIAVCPTIFKKKKEKKIAVMWIRTCPPWSVKNQNCQNQIVKSVVQSVVQSVVRKKCRPYPGGGSGTIL